MMHSRSAFWHAAGPIAISTVFGCTAMAQPLSQRLLSQTGEPYLVSREEARGLAEGQYATLLQDLQTQSQHHADRVIAASLGIRRNQPSIASAFDAAVAEAIQHPWGRTPVGTCVYRVTLPADFSWDALACEFMLKRDDAPAAARWVMLTGFRTESRTHRVETSRWLSPLAFAPGAPVPDVVWAAAEAAAGSQDAEFPGVVVASYQAMRSTFPNEPVQASTIANALRSFKSGACLQLALDAATQIQTIEHDLAIAQARSPWADASCVQALQQADTVGAQREVQAARGEDAWSEAERAQWKSQRDALRLRVSQHSLWTHIEEIRALLAQRTASPPP